MVAQKFKILSERTVCGSALVTLSDTKQGFIVPREKGKGVWRLGYATFVNFVRVYCICVYYDFNFFNSTWFFHSFWEIELPKQMTDQEDKINLGKIVSDDNDQERKSWVCLGQTCSRSLIVFLSQLFVNLLIIFGCFCRIHLLKTCDESTVWVGVLCSAEGSFLLSPRLWTS